MAARARNAAREGLWIAALGAVAVIVTLLALVTVPREADRQLRRRIAALLPVADSMTLVQRLDSLRTVRATWERSLIADSTLMRAADSLTLVQADSLMSDTLADLASRLRRAREMPLPDSYRRLAASPLLSGDARVAAALDSLNAVEQEREGNAALGGPDARYAALTARLATLGQTLVTLAERRLANTVFASLTVADSLAALPEAQAAKDALRDSLDRRVARAESALVSARALSLARDSQRVALESRLTLASPPMAMLLAALVVGLVAGYGVVLARELRRPSVGDVVEVERIAGAPALLHRRAGPSTLAERRSLRERPGVPRIIDRDSDTFVLLHLSLTGVGDMVSQADILSDVPIIGAAVALGTAAAAARDSRAVLIVETSREQALLAHVLNAKVRHTVDDVREGRVSAEEAVHVVTLDRDAHIDVLLADTLRPEETGFFRRRRRAAVPPVRTPRRPSPSPGPASSGDVNATADPERAAMQALATRYDLRLHLVGEAEGWAPARDVIICTRQGVTALSWLARAVHHTRSRQQRIRTVIVWERVLPET